jgi:hypothetical protein
MIYVGDHKVYETLPAGMVDLDKCSVCAWPVAEEEPAMIDNVIQSGVVVLYNTKHFKGDALGAFLFPSNIYWGKTAVNEQGFYNIVVDVPEITESILMALYIMNVIPE